MSQEVDLRPLLPPVRDQGRRGTCMAFAVTAAHEQRRMDDEQVVDDLAEEVLYWGCKQIDGNHAAGTGFESAGQALTRWGQPVEELWPYDPNRDDTVAAYSPPLAALSPTACRKGRLARIDATISEITRWLTQRRPVVLGVMLTLDFFQPVEGRIHLPQANALHLGGHAVVAVGFDARTAGDEFLILRNSWGPAWGDNGYGYLPYAYVTRYGVGAAVVELAQASSA